MYYYQTRSQELHHIQVVASWENDSSLEQLKRDFFDKYSRDPDADEDVKEAVQAGRIFGKKRKMAKDTAYCMGRENVSPQEFYDQMVKYSNELKKELKDLYSCRGKRKDANGFSGGNYINFEESYQKGIEARTRLEENKRHPPEDWRTQIAEDSQDGDSTVKIHKNSLSALRPSCRWTVMIDETGSAFTDESFRENGASPCCGRIVGVFIPEDASLKKLTPGWHSSDLKYDQIRDAAKDLVDSPCGVLGVSVDLLNRIHGNHWLYGIEALLDLAVRLLPIDGETTIDVYVEQRENYDEKVSFLLEDRLEYVLSRFARSFPQKARQITLKGHFIPKVGHPYNGYADTAAFLWGGSSVQNILKSTGWQGSCLIETPAEVLRDVLDKMERGEDLPPKTWELFLNSREARQDNFSVAFVAAILKNLGEETRQDIQRWRLYVDYTLDHLNSKAIQINTLQNQIEWLQKYAPDGEPLPPRLRLLWLTALLANQNHRGAVPSEEDRKEFQTLAEDLFDEDAPLACNAALHLAVSYTNSFDFQHAEEALEFWRDIQTAIPGRKYYAQTLSTLGQIKAFQGEHQEAIKYLQEAIKEFKQLSDPKESALEISQTRAYLVIEQMDTQPNSSKFFDEFKMYLDGSLIETAKKLAASDRSEDKYRHHIFLRYLASNADSEEAKKARQIYLKGYKKWLCGEGHPWELIEFYRALLLDSSQREEKIKRLQNAFKLAKKEKGTLRVIAAVIACALLELDAITIDDYRQLIKKIPQELSSFGNRFDALQKQPTEKIHVLELAKQVLPFNFR